MKSALSIALAASAMWPLAVFSKSLQADPADPGAAVPPTKYESATRDYQPWKDLQESPAKTWRAMNDGVTQDASGMEGMGDIPGGAAMETPANKNQSSSIPMPASHHMHHKGK